MAISQLAHKSFFECRIHELTRWFEHHAGQHPRKRSDDEAERSLAVWLYKSQQRLHSAIGDYPSKQVLNNEERTSLLGALRFGKEQAVVHERKLKNRRILEKFILQPELSLGKNEHSTPMIQQLSNASNDNSMENTVKENTAQTQQSDGALNSAADNTNDSEHTSADHKETIQFCRKTEDLYNAIANASGLRKLKDQRNEHSASMIQQISEASKDSHDVKVVLEGNEDVTQQSCQTSDGVAGNSINSTKSFADPDDLMKTRTTTKDLYSAIANASGLSTDVVRICLRSLREIAAKTLKQHRVFKLHKLLVLRMTLIKDDNNKKRGRRSKYNVLHVSNSLQFFCSRCVSRDQIYFL